MRDLIALPFYLFGAIVWILSVGPLILADKISGSRHSRHLIG